MDEWTPVRLGDLVDVKHGFAFKGEYFRDTLPGHILLSPGNFAIGGGFQLSKIKYYHGPTVPEYVLSAGDLLVTMTDLSKAGDTLGYPAIVPTDDAVYLHNQRLGKVLLKSSDVERDFIYWLLRTDTYRAEILASCTGSTVKHTSPGRIQAFRFMLPPKKERLKICETLNSLEEKIELNQRVSKTLDGMAQAIFRDWFVEFGPTRRKRDGASDPLQIMGGLVTDADRAQHLADLFPSEFDDTGLPNGWKAGQLGDLAKTVGTAVDPLNIAPETPYIGLEHMPRRSIALTEWEEAAKVSSNKSKFEKGQVLFGKLRPYFHKVGIAPIDGVCSTDIIVLDAIIPDDRPLVTACVSTEEFVTFTDLGSTGTKMPRTSWSNMKRYGVSLASRPVNRAYNEVVSPLLDKIVSNIHEIRTLAATRDLLLPKLMSGEIRLQDAEAAA